MTKKIYSVLALGILAGFLSPAGPSACAQDAAEKNQPEKSVPDKSTTEKRGRDRMPAGTYRVEFRITELEGEKRLNSRTYSLILIGDVKSQLRAGTRVPFSTGDPSKPGSTFQYLDIGQRIQCRVMSETERTINLTADLEFTNLALPEQANTAAYLPPIVRTFNSETVSMLDLNKPTVISTLDDPSSKHTFQIEVTATRLKE